MRNAVKAAYEYDPEAVRAAVVIPALEKYADAVIASVTLRKACEACGHKPRPTVGALRHFGQLAKLVGIPPTLNLLISQQIGGSIEEAKSAVQVVRSASDDEHEVAARAMMMLTAYHRKRGEIVRIEPMETLETERIT